MSDFFEDEFARIDAAKKKASTPKPIREPEPETEPEEKNTKMNVWSLFKNGIRAAKDAITGPKEEDKVVVDHRGSTPVEGHDLTYTVPTNIVRMRVQIMEPNGRLKNEYVLTNYLAIKGGDKFRIICE